MFQKLNPQEDLKILHHAQNNLKPLQPIETYCFIWVFKDNATLVG
jgi:hypothetical protein